jgi:tetratricopeptide (TPR) repeat protein
VLNSNAFNIVTLRECANAFLTLDRLSSVRSARSSAKHAISSNMQKAGTYLQRAMAVDSSNPQTLCMQALYYQQAGDVVQAENNFLKALELRTVYPDGLLHYSLFLKLIGESKLAQRFRHFYLIFQRRNGASK